MSKLWGPSSDEIVNRRQLALQRGAELKAQIEEKAAQKKALLLKDAAFDEWLENRTPAEADAFAGKGKRRFLNAALNHAASDSHEPNGLPGVPHYYESHQAVATVPAAAALQSPAAASHEVVKSPLESFSVPSFLNFSDDGSARGGQLARLPRPAAPLQRDSFLSDIDAVLHSLNKGHPTAAPRLGGDERMHVIQPLPPPNLARYLPPLTAQPASRPHFLAPDALASAAISNLRAGTASSAASRVSALSGVVARISALPDGELDSALLSFAHAGSVSIGQPPRRLSITRRLPAMTAIHEPLYANPSASSHVLNESPRPAVSSALAHILGPLHAHSGGTTGQSTSHANSPASSHHAPPQDRDDLRISQGSVTLRELPSKSWLLTSEADNISLADVRTSHHSNYSSGAESPQSYTSPAPHEDLDSRPLPPPRAENDLDSRPLPPPPAENDLDSRPLPPPPAENDLDSRPLPRPSVESPNERYVNSVEEYEDPQDDYGAAEFDDASDREAESPAGGVGVTGLLAARRGSKASDTGSDD